MAGNALSWAYTFECRVLGLAVVFWAKTSGTSSDQARGMPRSPGGRRRGAIAAGRGHGTEQVRVSRPPGRAPDDEDEELSAYNAYLARLNARGQGPRPVDGCATRGPDFEDFDRRTKWKRRCLRVPGHGYVTGVVLVVLCFVVIRCRWRGTRRCPTTSAWCTLGQPGPLLLPALKLRARQRSGRHRPHGGVRRVDRGHQHAQATGP